MKLTKQQAIEGHRKMWNWIADEIEKRKHTCRIFNLKMIYCHENVLNLQNDCFCCEYTDSIDNTCDSCILDWGITGDCGLLYVCTYYLMERASEICKTDSKFT